MINKRLDLSRNEEGFEKAKSLYETALNESACKIIMICTKTKTTKNKTQYAILYRLTCLVANMLKPTAEKHSSS